MNQEILINWSPQETRVAVIEYGAVQDVFVERALERGLVGNVYMGKVTRVLPGMQSAFIDIGLERAAFLHVADLLPNLNARHQRDDAASDADAVTAPTAPPIEHQVYEGQAILVQVLKDPIGTKGARLTAQVSIAGRLLVFLPQDDGKHSKTVCWRCVATRGVALFCEPMPKIPAMKTWRRIWPTYKKCGNGFAVPASHSRRQACCIASCR